MNIKEQEDLELRKEFDAMDIDKKGYLSKEEITTLLSRMYLGITEAEIDEQLKIYDANGDGQIDFDEFKEMSKNSKWKLNYVL